MKSLAKYIAYTIGALSTLYLLVMGIFTTSINSSSQETWKNMNSSSFNCPAGTEVTHRGWSENGTLRYCEPVKNGPWEAWMSGYKQVEGSYLHGKKQGQWRWFNKAGEITNTITYNNGVEVKSGN